MALAPFCDPGGIAYLPQAPHGVTAEEIRAAPRIEAMFEPEAERSGGTEFGIQVISNEPCLKMHRTSVSFSPNEGDVFEAQGMIWRIQQTENGGLGVIYCWSTLAVDIEYVG